MVYASTLLFSFLLASAFAVPTPGMGGELEGRSSSMCKTLAEGYLSTTLLKSSDGSLTSHWKPFTFNSRHELAYLGGNGKPIWAQFQACTPNYGGGTNKPTNDPPPSETIYWGRVYLPTYKQCLSVDNSNKNTGPYYVRRVACLNSAAGEATTKKSIPQNFAYRTFTQDTTRRILFWIGDTRADGTKVQGTCPGGFYGYRHDSTNVPIAYSRNRILAYCDIDPEKASVFAELRQTSSN